MRHLRTKAHPPSGQPTAQTPVYCELAAWPRLDASKPLPPSVAQYLDDHMRTSCRLNLTAQPHRRAAPDLLGRGTYADFRWRSQTRTTRLKVQVAVRSIHELWIGHPVV
jgi:hypothetical protein